MVQRRNPSSMANLLTLEKEMMSKNAYALILYNPMWLFEEKLTLFWKSK